jgi:hypothetical protein
MIAAYAHDITEPEWALGWRWDIVLDGPDATTFEHVRRGQDQGRTPRAQPEGSDPLEQR